MGAPRVLVTGLSSRAAAESAARAGFDVIAIDAFGDLDHHPAVHVRALPRDCGVPFTPRRAALEASLVETDAAVYLSGFENHPSAVELLARGRSLWGNAPSVLRRVRDPVRLARLLRRAGFEPPEIGDDRNRSTMSEQQMGRWLVKPRASGGGQRVRAWRPGAPVPRGDYLQAFIDGTPGSVVFVAAARRSVALGLSRQLTGERAFGVSGYRYCGSLLTRTVPDSDTVLQAASAMASVAAAGFDLVGVGGLDFVVANGVPRPIEVNPRWTASMELVERACGVSMFGLHAAACRQASLPSLDVGRVRAADRVVGKAVVFARAHSVAPDTRDWLGDPDIRDVPWPGTRIPAGQPICTVFAEGRDEATCHDRLVARADRIYGELARNRSTIATTSSGFSSLG